MTHKLDTSKKKRYIHYPLSRYLLIGGDVLELVCSCEDLPGGGVVVVAEVVRDDGAGADKVVVLVEEDAGPGELPGGGLAVGEAGHGASVTPGATGL